MQDDMNCNSECNAIALGGGLGKRSRTRRIGTDRAQRREIRPYLSSIPRGKRLSAEEERSLAEAIIRGDNEARSQLIQANLALVVKLAVDIAGHGVILDDLISEGNLALIKAAEQYQPSHGVRFCTYASIWIKKAMRQAHMSSPAIIRLPPQMLALLSKWRKAERALARDLVRAPTFDEVASVLGLSNLLKSRVARAQLVLKVQQESAVDGELGGWSSADAVDPYSAPELADELDGDRLLLEARLKSLNAREKRVLSLRHGFGKAGPMTRSAIARTLGITKECVRITELKAARKLRTEPASDTAPVGGTKSRIRQSRDVAWPKASASRRRRRAKSRMQPPSGNGSESKKTEPPCDAQVAPRLRTPPL